MSLYEQLAARLLKDLNRGMLIPKKDDKGNWYQKEIPYHNVLVAYCTGDVSRKCFLSVYERLAPLSSLAAEEKAEWKKFVNEIFPGTPPKFRLEALKIVYTIAVLSN